jgi:hypothetical protein
MDIYGKGKEFGLAREFEKELRIRLVMAVKEKPRAEIVPIIQEEIELPNFI